MKKIGFKKKWNNDDIEAISLMSAVCSVSLMTLAALLKGPSWLMIILAIIAVVSFIIGFIKGN